jgi:hypothetical protein
MIKLFPSRENLDLVSGIPGGEGKTSNLFLQCNVHLYLLVGRGYKGGPKSYDSKLFFLSIVHGRL